MVNPTLLFFSLLLLFIIAIFLIFRRQMFNLYHFLFNHKKFVVVHRRNPATMFTQTFLVVPDTEGLTKITDGLGKNESYHTLRPEFAVLKWKNRLHFVVDFDDVVPRKIGERTSKDVIIPAKMVRSSLRAKAYDILYGEKRDITLYICMLALLISIAAAIYAVSTINDIKPLIQVIYEKTNPAQIVIQK